LIAARAVWSCASLPLPRADDAHAAPVGSPGRSHRPDPVRVSWNARRLHALSGACGVGGSIVACGAKRSRLRRGQPSFRLPLSDRWGQASDPVTRIFMPRRALLPARRSRSPAFVVPRVRGTPWQSWARGIRRPARRRRRSSRDCRHSGGRLPRQPCEPERRRAAPPLETGRGAGNCCLECGHKTFMWIARPARPESW
jgi:hypothetical protein